MYSTIKEFVYKKYIKYIIRPTVTRKEVFYTTPRTKHSEPCETKRVTFTATKYFQDYKIDGSKEKNIIFNEVIGDLEFVKEDNVLVFVENHRIKKVLTVEVIIENVKKPKKSNISEERRKYLEELAKPIGT